jgi:tellurite resistance protein TehA-like permease
MSAPSSTVAASAASTSVDPRGQRFAAALTSLVLVAALLLAPSTATLALLAWQLATFAAGVALGPARTPYAWVFRTFVRPRLGPPGELEDVKPARFAQSVGLAFAAVALLGYAAGVTWLGAVAAGLALGAAFLNAAFGYCLGCEMYLALRRVTSGRSSVSRPEPAEA